MLDKGASDMANGGQSHKTFLYKFINLSTNSIRSTVGWVNMLKQKIPSLKAL